MQIKFIPESTISSTVSNTSRFVFSIGLNHNPRVSTAEASLHNSSAFFRFFSMFALFSSKSSKSLSIYGLTLVNALSAAEINAVISSSLISLYEAFAAARVAVT